MDFKPVCLRVTFCNVKLLVSVSPFKTILDLKKEVSRVYHKHYPQKTEECKHVQDSSGYLACDDYQIGLVFSNGDSVFALAAGHPLDKYSELWKNNDSSKLIADGELENDQHHIKPISNKSTVTSTPAVVREHLNELESDEASETDCSNELIPQVLEGSHPTHTPKPSVDVQKVNTPNLQAKNLPQNKKEMSKNKSTMAFTDSSLSDTDSELVSPKKGGGKATEDEAKLTPKKNSRTLQKHKKQEQNIVTFTAAGDKIKGEPKHDTSRVDSTDTRKSLGQKFQLAIDDANGSTPAVTKKLRTKRKHTSDEAQGTSSEKKAKKKISKKELELANTSSQSMILDNAKLWTE